MIGPPDTVVSREFSPGLEQFDDDFFKDYEQELAAVDVAVLAQEALAAILTVQGQDGETKTYEQIRYETEAFFANPVVANDLSILRMAAMQWAMFCMQHNHEGGDALTSGSLGDMYAFGEHALHEHHSHSEKNKKKKKTTRWLGFWSLFVWRRRQNREGEPEHGSKVRPAKH